MRYSKTKEIIIGGLISIPLILVGCGTCDTGAECAENSQQWTEQGTRASDWIGDIVEIGGDLTGQGLQLLGEGIRISGRAGGEVVRKSGGWLADKTRGLANLHKALEMGIQEANR